MTTPNPDRILHTTQTWPIRHKIDWKHWQAVVFESDDWGACENAPNTAAAEQVGKLWTDFYQSKRAAGVGLESPKDLERLYTTLERFKGADALPAAFTAFICACNPDFDEIRRNGFTRYASIGIDHGVPQGWERGWEHGAIAKKWRDGIARGVFVPEFHGFLHHTSPKTWMHLLRAAGPEGDLARELFDLKIYYQGRHVPEYEGMNVREQNAFVKTGIETFIRATGYKPAASVTSDAYPVTETIWSLNGIRIICLKNCKMNTGEVVVYHTKPWNNQNTYVPIGAYNSMDDVIYLTRNAWFENHSSDETFPVILNRWSQGEPAMVSTHRSIYVSQHSEHIERGYAKLEDLLSRLAAKGARFLTTAEIGDLYRQGWSLRTNGDIKILRKWAEDAEPIRLESGTKTLTATPSGKTFTVKADGTADIPLGDYLVN